MDINEYVSKLTEIFTDGVEAGATFALGDPSKASADTIANSTKLVELAKDYNALTSEVTALRARVAELEAEARWVSVEQGLPERAKRVMIFVEETHVQRTAWLDCVNRDGEPLFVYYETPGRIAYENSVTHWRPLPAPPEAE